MTAAPEFHRPFRADTIGELARRVEIAADASERAALAQRFGLESLDRLEAEAVLKRERGAIVAEGRIRAEVVQACVATGEPVPAAIDEPFGLRFVTEEHGATGEEIELDEADLDTIPYDGALVDLGEAVAETLSLALDPFPRAPGADAALREAGVVPEGEEVRENPFAKLKGLLKE